MFQLAVIIILSSLILGGGTSYGFLSDATLQLISIPILLVSIWQLLQQSSHNQPRSVIFFCFILISIPLLQLIPLPPHIWTALPGRDTVSAALKLSLDTLPSMPLSLSPRATWLSFLSFLPPLAIFMTVHQLGYKDRKRLSLVIIIFGVISVFLGLLQMLQGTSSPLRFFENTNPTEAVGFFANRNHFAALLYSITLLTVAWIIAGSDTSRKKRSSHAFNTTRILYIITSITVIAVLTAGQLMARSRSGLGLTIIALAAIYFMNKTTTYNRKGKSSSRSTKLIWTGLILIFLLSSQFALFRVMDRFNHGVDESIRVTFAQITTQAAWENMPFGTGLGSFVPVFKQYETPSTPLHGIYANHAHNDFLETWLETGVIGIIIICIFIIWYSLQSYRIWRHPLQHSPIINQSLAKAATIIIALLLLHSLVSYPLRTAAIMGLFTFSCALLTKPPANTHEY